MTKRAAYGTTARRSSTSVTPGAAQAARSASCRSAHECTLPLRITFPSCALTWTRLASISALRLKAASILSWTSVVLTRGLTMMLLITPSVAVDQHVIELLFLADACRRAGAARLTAVVPYFGYARQDRRASGREAVGARVIADLIEAAGFARVVAIDLHTPAIEGFCHIPLEHLSAAKLLAEAVRTTNDTVIVAPDLGAVKIAERYQAFLHLPVVLLHKTRVGGSEVSVRSIIGDVKDLAPLIIDDMITTGRHHRGGCQGPARRRLQARCVSPDHARALCWARDRAATGVADSATNRNQQRGTRERAPCSLPSCQRSFDDRGHHYAAASRPVARASPRARMNGTRSRGDPTGRSLT